MVRLPGPSNTVPWLFDFERELCEFPAAEHDDQVDAFTQAVIFLEYLLAGGARARARQQPDDAA